MNTLQKEFSNYFSAEAKGLDDMIIRDPPPLSNAMIKSFGRNLRDTWNVLENNKTFLL